MVFVQSFGRRNTCMYPAATGGTNYMLGMFGSGVWLAVMLVVVMTVVLLILLVVSVDNVAELRIAVVLAAKRPFF